MYDNMILFLDDKDRGEEYAVISPHNFLFLDSIACFDIYAKDRFRYNVCRGFWSKLFKIRPKSWSQFEKEGYRCIKIKIKGIKI